MKLTRIIRTPKAEVLITREDVRLIEACTMLHYDVDFMRYLLNKLRIYVEDTEQCQIILSSCELDITAKMLEKASCLPNVTDSDVADRQKAADLRDEIGALLKRLNEQYEEDNGGEC